jgi:alkaline phosphatase
MHRLALTAALGLLVIAPPPAADGVRHARNVILLLADAGGIPTINAASRLGYDAPRRLFVQRMPFIALSETSTASEWVTDSAAGMTAIVTGERTHNGVIAEGADAIRGNREGAWLKTILEEAEERGLSTGLITNDSVAGATPAALYAHVNDRSRYGDIVLQLFTPRFGDGPDVVIGPSAAERAAVAATGRDLAAIAEARGRPLLDDVAAIPGNARRALVFTRDSSFDLGAAVNAAIRMLSANPKGYFLMVESDAHTDNPERGLSRLVAFDRIIQDVASKVQGSTLLLFTADHSFDFRVRSGRNGQSLLEGLDPESPRATPTLVLPHVRVDNSHTGEEVLVAASGPGAERVHGYLANTDLFRIMTDALGWPSDQRTVHGTGTASRSSGTSSVPDHPIAR